MRACTLVCLALALCLSAVTAWAGPASAQPTTGGRGTLEINMVGFRNAEGQALVAVFRSDEGFPNHIEHAAFHKAFKLHKRTLRIVLEHLPAGPLAVAVQHDEDGDFEMDTGVFGIPREGFGTSRDAKARFGPPDYEDARIVLRQGQTQKLLIHLRYF